MSNISSNASSAMPSLFWGHAAEFWDTCLIWSVVFAAIAAGAIGISTVGSIRGHKLAADNAKRELDRFKAETAGSVAEAHIAEVEAGVRAGHAQAGVDAAKVEIAKQQKLAAEANERGLKVSLELALVTKAARGREISDLQAELVKRETRGLLIPHVIIRAVDNQEATTFALSLQFLIQELGGTVDFEEIEPPFPRQEGAMFCALANDNDLKFGKALGDAGLLSFSGRAHNDPVCPPGTIFVGLKPPEQALRAGPK